MSIESSIRSIIAEEVAAAERRILDSLAVQSDMTLTFQDACKYLNMSEYTLRDLCRTKKIPHRTVGAEGSNKPRYLFSSNSLDKWIEEQESKNYIAK